DGAKGGVVYLVEQSTYNGIYDALAKFFLNSKASKDTILGKTFEISRKGSKFNDTSYTIIAVEDIPDDATPITEFELVDVQEVVPEVPYQQQDAFLHKGSAPAAPSGGSAPEQSSPTSTDESW